MLEKIKLNLRLHSNAFDSEIMGLVFACISDLKIAGIKINDYTDGLETFGDPLIDYAIIVYCKAHFGQEYKEAFETVYKDIKNTLVIGKVNSDE